MAEIEGIDVRMTAEAFMAWHDEQPDGPRYELFNGRVFEIQREPVMQVRAKGAFAMALARTISARNLPCEAFADGMAVRIDDFSVFQPDAQVRCGPRLPGDTVLILDPAVVIEIISTVNQHVDVVRKFNGYFRNPAVVHYLIVNSVDGNLVHHRRMPDGRIESAHRDGGLLALDPPGLELDLDALFEGGFGG